MVVNMKKPTDKQIEEFLQHSNWIENERSDKALIQAKRAWDYAWRNKDKINIEYILDIHKILMIKSRPDIAGKIRNCDVWIGGNRKEFISEALIRDELEHKLNLIEDYKNIANDLKEEFVKDIHVKFEDIHPFEDGNGRVGRILWQIHRLRLGLPIHIIHEGEEQQEYYKWFE